MSSPSGFVSIANIETNARIGWFSNERRPIGGSPFLTATYLSLLNMDTESSFVYDIKYRKFIGGYPKLIIRVNDQYSIVLGKRKEELVASVTALDVPVFEGIRVDSIKPWNGGAVIVGEGAFGKELTVVADCLKRVRLNRFVEAPLDAHATADGDLVVASKKGIYVIPSALA
jgi:hypothetical protein